MKSTKALLSFLSLILIFSNQGFASTQVDLLIKNGIVVTMDSEFNIVKNGVIAVKDSKIQYVGDGKEKNFQATQTIDAKGRLVVPGLINGHTHIPMTLFRGIADDMKLMDWLQNYIWPAEKKNVNSEFVYWGTKLGCLEMIQSGTTMFNDMYFFEGDIAKATQECGLRAILAETVLDFPAPDNNKITDPELRWNNGLNQAREYIKKWKNNSLITPAIGPHAAYTVSPAHLKQVAKLAKELNAPIHIHVAETKNESELIQSAYKVDLRGPDLQLRSPVQYLNLLGFLSSQVISAHTVLTSKEDRQVLADALVGVVHCPQSNARLATSIANVTEMIEQGVSVGLGTDGAASNNDQDLWQEINLVAIQQKQNHEDPTAMNARDAFSMATINGAKALHMGKQIGSLETGKNADIVIVNNRSSHHIPYGTNNIYSELVYVTKGSDVDTVIVNGKILMLDKKLLHLNQERIFEKAETLRQKIDESLRVKTN